MQSMPSNTRAISQPTRSPAARRHVEWLYEIPHHQLRNRLAFLLILFLYRLTTEETKNCTVRSSKELRKIVSTDAFSEL